MFKNTIVRWNVCFQKIAKRLSFFLGFHKGTNLLARLTPDTLAKDKQNFPSFYAEFTSSLSTSDEVMCGACCDNRFSRGKEEVSIRGAIAARTLASGTVGLVCVAAGENYRTKPFFCFRSFSFSSLWFLLNDLSLWQATPSCSFRKVGLPME